MTILMFVIGLAALIAGAELLVRGASKLALSFGISPLVVGLTVVAFGTSSPELAVSVQSAYAGQVALALGNVVGSNIFNVLFILGASALITPLLVNAQLVRQEVPIMVAATLLTFGLAVDGGISRFDGALLFGLLIVYIVFLIRQSRAENSLLESEFEEQLGVQPTAVPSAWDDRLLAQLGLVVAGLILLVSGSNWLVDAAISFAKALGVSEMVIGLTIVAAGTSMPEVATSVMAAVRGERDIAVGNVVGSNIFNLLGVLGASALVAPTSLMVAQAMIDFDMVVMVAVAIICLPIFFTGHLIARWEGGVFFLLYVAYTAYLVLAAQHHAALTTYSFVVGTVLLPVLMLTLAVTAWREWRSRG